MSFHFHLFFKSLNSCHFTAKHFKQGDSKYYSWGVKRAENKQTIENLKQISSLGDKLYISIPVFKYCAPFQEYAWKYELTGKILYIMTAETVRNLNATVLIYMMKLFTLVCCFVVDLPHGRRLYYSNPGVNNSLVSNSNGWDALNVITSVTSQMYVSPLSKCPIQQAVLSDQRGFFFADFVHKRTRTHTHNLGIPHAIQKDMREFPPS